MAGERVDRRLAAVLAADVAGYSRLMGADEEGTLARLKAARKAVVEPAIASHRGRIVKTTGDGMLVEFASAVDAARCSVEIQRAMAAQNADLPLDVRIELRIGVHVGDIIIDDNDIFGDGVNIAARLEGIAEPGGVCISDDTYRQIRGKVEIGLEDIGPQTLKNIAEPMRAWRVQLDGQAAAKLQPASTAGRAPGLALPDKPSIAVLPFQNMSGDPEQEYFADGMVEDIITALSRFKSLFVIARNSCFTYKGKAVDIKQVGRELGVRYVLEGSVRKAGGRVRITGQLIDVSTDAHVWAEKFDRSLDDIFALQDDVTAAVVQQINPKIEQAEIERTRLKPTGRLDSYDYFLRGMALIHSYDFSDRTRELFQKASQLDPSYAAAYAMESCVLVNQQATFGRKLSEVEKAETLRLAETAAKLANDDAFALARSAETFAILGSSYDRATGMVDRATTLNPNLQIAWHARGWVAICCCQGERAIDSFDRSARLSPRDRAKTSAMIGSSYALWMLGRYDEGFALAAKALEFGKTVLSLTPYIANAAASGRLNDAREAVQALSNTSPDYRLSNIRERQPFRDGHLVDQLVGHFQQAGLPP